MTERERESRLRFFFANDAHDMLFLCCFLFVCLFAICFASIALQYHWMCSFSVGMVLQLSCASCGSSHVGVIASTFVHVFRVLFISSCLALSALDHVPRVRSLFGMVNDVAALLHKLTSFSEA